MFFREVQKLESKKHKTVSVLDGICRYISFQDAISIDWNLEEFAAKAKKSRPGIFGLLGKSLLIYL
jgi:hypothetical protein